MTDIAPTADEINLNNLSIEARLKLVEMVWDSLPKQMSPEDVPAWHVRLLQERLAAAQRDPHLSFPYQEVLANLGKKK